jgi:hypothetical protein
VRALSDRQVRHLQDQHALYVEEGVVAAKLAWRWFWPFLGDAAVVMILAPNQNDVIGVTAMFTLVVLAVPLLVVFLSYGLRALVARRDVRGVERRLHQDGVTVAPAGLDVIGFG